MLGDGRPLRAYWSKKEWDVMIDTPTGPSGHWLASVFCKEFLKELDERGYDKTTLRFSVKQRQESKAP